MSHIDERFAGDTNMDVGKILVALVYPTIVVIGASPEFRRCDVDVSQPDFYVEPDCYPLKQFLEKFPHVCQNVVEAHDELLQTFLQRRDLWNLKAKHQHE